MKPKKRAAARSSTSPAKARTRRQRLRRSPRKASLSSNGASPDKDAKKPPPEFAPFEVEEDAPHFATLLTKDYAEECYSHNDMIALQYEMEMMLGHAMDNLKRVHGELSFLKCGEYPKHDLDKRLLPVYNLYSDGPTPVTVDEEEEGGQSSSIYQTVPSELDDDDDDPNEWPPPHVPPRFWAWARETFLAPLDATFMREWKEEFMNPLSVDSMAPLLVNAPWKYRKSKPAKPSPPKPKRQRVASGESMVSLASSGRGSKRGGRRASGHDELQIPKCLPDTADLLPLFTDLVDTYCEEKMVEAHEHVEVNGHNGKEAKEQVSPAAREKRDRRGSKAVVQEISPPTRRVSHRLQGKHEHAGHHDESASPQCNGHSKVKNGWVNGRKRESPARAPAVESRKSPGRASAHETQRAKREREREEREREREREERERLERERQERVKSLKEQAAKAHERLTNNPTEFMRLGKRMMRELVESGVIPTSTAQLMSSGSPRKAGVDDDDEGLGLHGLEEEKEEDDVLIDTEGREDPNEPMDDVSRELLKVQRRLLDTSKKFRGTVNRAWRKLKSDFAYHETNEQLNAAEDDLFSIAEHYYCPRPLRTPKPQEIPVLQAALNRQLVMAKMHYGPSYKHCIPIYPEDRKKKKKKRLEKLKRLELQHSSSGSSLKREVKTEAPMSPRVKSEPMSP